jgi:hypothetical protein
MLIYGDDFTIENGRAQFPLRYYFGDGREFRFQCEAFRDQRRGMPAELKTVMAR